MPSIMGVAAPAAWLAELGGSLARQTGKPVHVTAPSWAGGQNIGIPSGDEPTRVVSYAGVDRISADFELRCDPVVRGTFQAWSRTVNGAVFCGDSADTRPDAFARLASALCPDMPPPSAPPDAEEFHPEDQPAE